MTLRETMLQGFGYQSEHYAVDLLREDTYARPVLEAEQYD